MCVGGGGWGGGVFLKGGEICFPVFFSLKNNSSLDLVSSADFFSKSTFLKKKNSFRNTLRVPKGLNPDIQTVCKGYQQTTQVTSCFEERFKAKHEIRSSQHFQTLHL